MSWRRSVAGAVDVARSPGREGPGVESCRISPCLLSSRDGVAVQMSSGWESSTLEST